MMKRHLARFYSGKAKRKRVLYVQYSNPAIFPPLEHSSRILADAGFEVRFLGIAGATADELEFPHHCRIEIKTMPGMRPGLAQKLHYLFYGVWCLWNVVLWRPDWVYSSDIFGAPIGLTLRYVGRRKVIFHEHDCPHGMGASLIAKLCKASRRCLARTADIRIAPNAERAKWLSSEEAAGAPVAVVWNCPRRDEIAPSRELFAGPLRILYQGSINSERVPLAILHGMAETESLIELLIVGYETSGSLGYVNEISDLAQRLGIGKRVHILGALPRFKLSAIRKQCHLGIALVPKATHDRNFLAMTGASNKVFDYLAGGICPIVTDLSDWRETFVEPGYALECDPDDPNAMERLFTWCANHTTEVWTIAERGRARLMRDWNYEEQFAPVLRRMVLTDTAKADSSRRA